MRTILSSLILLTTTVATLAQNPNQAAVDTLTKDVAKAVFANIAQNNQPKAQEIYMQLADCSDGCDPQTVIRTVGGWDAVGVKMQELSELKNTQRFQGLSPGDANAAIRNEFAKFYNKYKSDRNYGKPLTQAVQNQILAKIDELLPPNVTSAEAPPETDEVTGKQAPTDETINTPTSVDTSKNSGTTSDDSLFWMMLATLLVGLLGGAAAVYFLLYKETKGQADQLRTDNEKLSRELDALRRIRPTNEPRHSQDADRQKARAYETLISELGTDVDPLDAIRKLKQQKNATSSSTRSEEPTVEQEASLESALVQQPLTPLPPLPPLEPLPPVNRSEVFYFPPPDPSGQFDTSQKSDTLIPESAYRFSVNAENPLIATFRFEADPGRVARFLTYRNYMIEPACDSENTYSGIYTRVIMRQDGEANLENGVWRVKTKALIRYE